MTSRKKTRLSLDLETVKALDQIHGGLQGPFDPPATPPFWQPPHTPPLHFHSENPSCGIVCLNPPPRRRRRHR